MKPNPDPTESRKRFDFPTPHTVVAAFAFDGEGRFVLQHRSPNVRSAPNVWSLPTGLHDWGESMHTAIQRELAEELNLFVHPDKQMSYQGFYENILPDWHWVLHVFTVPVLTHQCLVNRELDKHDKIELVPFDVLYDTDEFIKRREVHESFVPFLQLSGRRIANQIHASLSK